MNTLRALAAAYPTLGIEATLVDPPGGKVGNPRFEVTRTLAGDRLSLLFSCGRTMTGDRADEDRIYISLVSAAVPLDATHTVVETRAEAVARDVRSGNSGATLPCESLGVLERRLNEAARGRLPR